MFSMQWTGSTSMDKGYRKFEQLEYVTGKVGFITSDVIVYIKAICYKSATLGMPIPMFFIMINYK